jgi:hypothetical protein
MKPGPNISQIPGLNVSQTTKSNSRGNVRLLGPIGGGQGFCAGLLSKANISLVAYTSLEEPKTCQAKEDKIIAEDPSYTIYQ